MSAPSLRFKLLLLAATALTAPALAQELPTGGSVQSGSVGIATPAPGTMTINQSSQKAIVNWQGFSIGEGGTVAIHQPGAQAAILNRVTGSATTTIAGQLTANGQVFIVNPNGIAITGTGTVNAGGFVASTLGISDADFNTGNHVFTGDGTSAGVSNAGAIDIARGGYAALIGGRVDNSGIISAPLGKIGLGAGERATLDLTGDGFLQVALPSQGSGEGALVTNSGTISADGGRIEITAAAAQDAARNVINLSGVTQARTVSGQSGAIVLGGGGGGVKVTGSIDVSAPSPVRTPPVPQMRPPALGGSVTITGAAIELAGATIDASGTDGGGSVKIGGDFGGAGTLPHARTLSVDAGTLINADATGSGDGGQVALWSDLGTKFAGTITARGAGSGMGGMAEVSGGHLKFSGVVDLGAPSGNGGTLIIDPTNLVIDDSDPGISGFSWVDSASLIAALDGGTNVQVSTESPSSDDGDLIVNDTFGWNTGATLTLSSNRDMTISGGSFLGGPAANIVLLVGRNLDAGMEIRGADLTVTTGGDAYLNFLDLSGRTTVNAIGNVLINTSANSDGGFLVNAGGDITTSLIALGLESTNGDIEFNAGNDIWLGHPYLRALNGSVLLDAGRDINVRSDVTASGPLSATAGRNIDLSVDDPESITQSGSLSGAPLFIQAGGRLLIAEGTSVSATAGDAVINVGQFINQMGVAGVSASAGRFLIYSTNWEDDERGGLTGGNLYGRTYAGNPPPTIPGTGDMFIYSDQPVLTVSIVDGTRVYRMPGTLTASVSYDGLINGDTLDQAVAGTITDTSGESAGVGLHSAVLTAGGLTSPIGYIFSVEGGDLTITPAPLTITANDLSKLYGQSLVFDGTEFTTEGLLGPDTVNSVVLSSSGAPASASIEGSPYAILAGNASGVGLSNYTITYQPGSLTVVPASGVTGPSGAILVGNGTTIVNPPDTLAEGFAPEVAEEDARLSLQVLEERTQDFRQRLAACEEDTPEDEDAAAEYISCVSEALEEYAADIEDPLIRLPPELQSVSSVMRTTVRQLRAAASAPTPRAAVAQARAAIGNLVDFVRQQTELVRAVDPETEALLVEHGNVIAGALEDMDVAMVGAVEI